MPESEGCTVSLLWNNEVPGQVRAIKQAFPDMLLGP